MTLTPEQKQARRKRIGASDISAIVDYYGPQESPHYVKCNPFKSAADVWASKVLGADEEAGEAAAMGIALEWVILDYAQNALGVPINNFSRGLVVKASDYVSATLDGLTQQGSKSVPVEAKTVGPRSPVLHEFGEDGSDFVPNCYLWQCQIAMAATDAEVCELFAMIADRGFTPYRFTIRRHDTLIKKALGYAERFWNEHVLTGQAPEGCEPASLAALKKVQRVHDKTVEVPAELVEQVQTLRRLANATAKEKEAAEARLLMALGDATCGTCELGTVEIVTSKRRGYTVEDGETTRLVLPKTKGEVLIGD